MEIVYGGDTGEFASSGLVFAGKNHVTLTGPSATKSGVLYRGCMSYGTLYEGAPLTVQKLI